MQSRPLAELIAIEIDHADAPALLAYWGQRQKRLHVAGQDMRREECGSEATKEGKRSLNAASSLAG
jgi:hypothetical protein